MRRVLLHRAGMLLLMLLYWGISLDGLTIAPPIYEDEPWQASTGWKLATDGVFGSDMFAGFYGMERHYYGYMPLHPLLLAVVFRTGGVGLFQARFETVALGLIVLALTFALGRRLFSAPVGLLAVYFLLVVRLTGLTPSQYSGIPLLDMARIARYDMLVPVFGLMSLHAHWSAERAAASATRWRWYALAGFLAALAGLSHLYGLFWMVALVLLALCFKRDWRELAAMSVAFLLPWLLYVAYVLSGLPDWIGQTRGYAPRFELLNLRWYLTNLLQEYRRYGAGLGPPGWHYLLRPGFWAAVLAVPLSLLALGRRASRGDRAATELLVPAVLLPLLFALLITLKLPNYLVTMTPLFALAGSWGAVTLWRRFKRRANGNQVSARSHLARLGSLTLLLVLLVISLEGSWRIAGLKRAATSTTPYASFIEQVQDPIPDGARVLGMHHYWFGFENYDYHTWYVPLVQLAPRDPAGARSISTALDRLAPEVVLIDRRLRAYFDDFPLVADAVGDWLAEREYRRVAMVEDATYGRMEIYRVTR